MPRQSESAYSFGPFVLDPAAHILRRDGEPVPLPPKAFDTLLLLVQQPGNLLSKDELLNAVWPDAYVEENNLTQYVSMLRKTLGGNGDSHKYIETVPRLGYRFVGRVEQIAYDEPLPAKPTEVVVGEDDGPPGVASEARSPESLDGPAPRPTVTPAALFASRVLVAASAAVILFGLAAIYVRLWGPAKPPVPSARTPAVRTLAVLPLRNLKPDPETDFLSLALTDAIINRLGYVSELAVQPCSYVAKYRNGDADPRQIARELNVQMVLAASYVKEGDEIRVTTELIDVAGRGEPSRDTIDLKYQKLMTVQDRIALSVIHSMGLALQPQEIERFKRGLPTSPVAYEYYLRGFDLEARTDFAGANRLLEKSVSLEPGNAMAWAFLANSYLGFARVQGGGKSYAEKGWKAFRKAQTLDPDNPLIGDMMAFQMIENNKMDQAVSTLRELLRHDASDSFAHWYLSEAYRYGGALEQSVQEGERAEELNPAVSNTHFLTYLYVAQYRRFLESLPANEDNARTSFYRGLAYCSLKDTPRAIQEFQHAFELSPSLLHSRIGEALVFALTGRQPRGIELMRQVEASDTVDGEMVYKMAQAYAQLGAPESALRLLRRSIELNFYPRSYFLTDPLLEPIRAKPEYSALMELASQRQEAFRKQFF